MHKFLVIFLLLSFTLYGQDKLFLTDGTSKKGIVISKAKDVIYFKTSDTSVTEKISKSRILMIEDYKGDRFLFSSQTTEPDSVKSSVKNKTQPRNIISAQPIGLLFGRATVVYERLSEDAKIGLVIPLSITFDPFGTMYNSRLDTNQNAIKRISGVKFITGFDLNFYLGNRKNKNFFVGPRVRYGTDLFLRNVEGYTIQTQMGWKFSKPEKKIVQHLSLGFGFVRVLSIAGSTLIDPKQSYSWFSLNYRVGVKW